MAWFKKTKKPIESTEKPSRIPEGLWVKCPGCSQIIYNKDLDQNVQVCPKCTHHFRISATDRLRALFDDGEWTEHFRGLTSNDPLQFHDTKPYKHRLKDTISKTGMSDAVIVATGKLDGLAVVVAAMEYAFIGGSMGVVVGEKITRAIELALDRRYPVIVISCSGGARMMEGTISLMQLLIGFAGPRVIEQTIRQKLPEGFQRSEFLLEHGMLDLIVDRREMKATISRALRFMGAEVAATVEQVAVTAE